MHAQTAMESLYTHFTDGGRLRVAELVFLLKETCEKVAPLSLTLFRCLVDGVFIPATQCQDISQRILVPGLRAVRYL
jgi:hypothetical protein